MGSKFCGQCGTALDPTAAPVSRQADRYPQADPSRIISQGERRHLTVLFTDLTGYTRLMEKYDPEDIQAIMTAITQTCIGIIASYNGHVERILGDEILGLFGLPKAHEDDAIRAIKAAREIHETVSGMRPASIHRTERIAMHTGINTGLVVTTRPAPKNGTFDLSGDAVNLASRLSDMAKPNQILVGPETYRQAFGFFDFDAMPAMNIKGKSLPISVYSVLGEKDQPIAGRRELKFTAPLIGRNAELELLLTAMRDLENGQGAIISLVGDAGTGKSRLLNEFERQLRDKTINWITGYAFAHTQHAPYFPLVHLVRRWLDLDGSATDEQMRKGIAQRVGKLLGANAEEIPILQGLIGLDVKDTAGMSPEEWRSRLKSAMLNLLSAIARQAPTIFCMEDIHWGDAASFKLLKDIIFSFPVPAIVIYTSRPHASLFTSHEQEVIAPIYKEIRLGELSPSQTEDMMRSMLNTASLPQDLCRLIHKRAEGNPFYLEEILNALVETGALVLEQGRWRLHREFKESDIPSTIHGIIASHMDQLGPTERRILQEAAVIGRVFLFDILKQISTHTESVDSGLYKLERAGLIIPRSLHPEMEFMYKHALIQEVSYGSLLRSERQQIHERVGRIMERIYQDRLSEFDETLALHFRKSKATYKAVDYLIRSGKKAMRRCALDESDQFFITAIRLLEEEKPASRKTKKRLLDAIHQYAFVFYYKGQYRRLLELLEHHLPLVDGLKDPVREGFHWAWHGCALWHRHRFAESFDSLSRALALGEQADHPYVTAYAHTWLSMPCSELGRFDEAIENSRKAMAFFEQGRVKDPYTYFHALTGIGYAAWHKGDIDLIRKTGSELLQFGKRNANVRSLVAGHCCHGWRGLITGDVDSATESFNAAVQLSSDPWYTQFPKLALAFGLISNHKIDEALPLLDQLIEFSEENGAEFVGEPAHFFKGLTSIVNGQAKPGLEIMETRLASWTRAGDRLRCLTCGYVMANVYSMLYEKALQNDTSEASQMTAAMARKSQQWFQTCIAEAEEMGAKAMQGQALLGLGNLLAAMGYPDQARKALYQSHDLLERSRADTYLQRADALLESIENCKV
jgi:class 3 adenylate cyclase/tetratricopeptide (TPR) repeat protein